MTTPDPGPSSLAGPSDLALFSLGSLSAQDAQSLLDIASAEARGYAGWMISEETYDVTLDSSGDSVLMLPAMHVTAVTTVEVSGTATTDFTWSAHGAIEGCWPAGRRNIHVVFTAGYDPVPKDVVGAVCGLAARTAATRGGFTSQRIGSLALSGMMAGGFADPEGTLSRYKLP